MDTIISPNDDTTFYKGEVVEVSVEASDADGLIEEVQLYVNGVGESSVQTFPYIVTWSTQDANLGENIIKAVAIDNRGGKTEDEITVNLISYSIPTITTNDITNITINSCNSGGNIANNGGKPITSRGVCWSNSTNPSIYDNKTLDGSGIGSFSSLLSDLEYGTTYYVRAYATNEIGTGYGEQVTFTTLNPPSVDVSIEIEGYDATFTVSAQYTTSYSWDYGDGNTSTIEESHIHTYDEIGVYSVTLIVYGEGGEMEKTFIIGVPSSVTFTYSGTQVTYGTVVFASRIWLDRNLGATRVAVSKDDDNAFGDLFQWGRTIDGHQNRASQTIQSDMTLDTQPVEGFDPEYGYFIIPPGEPGDWADPSWIHRWTDAEGIKTSADGCPNGWRIPTNSEWQLALEEGEWLDGEDAFNSSLKLPYGGYKIWNTNGVIAGEGTGGNYWSSTPIGEYAGRLSFGDSGIGVSTTAGSRRANAMSIRCINDQ